MNVDYAALKELFRLHDVDGLISSGAPSDEYEPEVERIAAALERLPRERASVTAIADIFDAVWTEMFGKSEEQRRRRRFDFEDIAEKVMRAKPDMLRRRNSPIESWGERDGRWRDDLGSLDSANHVNHSAYCNRKSNRGGLLVDRIKLRCHAYKCKHGDGHCRRICGGHFSRDRDLYSK